jgi:hypothetical protein
MAIQQLIGYNLYLKPTHKAYRTLLQPLGLEYVPVTGPDPRPIHTPGQPPRPGYLIDVQRLTDDQVGQIVAALSIAFKASPIDVIVQILTVGLPILARDCDPPVPAYAPTH